MAVKKRALQLVTEFEARKGVGCWPRLSRETIGDELRKRLDNPNLIDQSATNTCGVASMLRFWAQDNPSGYAWLAISLFEKGTGYVGTNPTAPPRSCAATRSPSATVARKCLRSIG